MTPPLSPDARRALLTRAAAIADEAGRIAARAFRTGLDVEAKADASPVTMADRETERALRAALRDALPEAGLLGEEYGAADLDRPLVWVVDPIDGTKSFISGMPLFGTLVGLLEHGTPVAGVIHMPALGETFAGGAGLGAWLNDRPVSCRPTRALAEAFVCCNDLGGLIRAEPEAARRLLDAPRILRPTGDCYPYGQLAAGWVDAVVDFGLQPYDYLPVVGVVEGAGGVITDWRGHPLTRQSDGRVVAAATPDLHAALLRVLEAA
ncbi:inositol monophosphatase family protein [Roseospira navarrensis]|uniref:Inositol-1-monophosphatase n=1 Tax=Roseospira navarrensis TaxID=140058 RepID=A0A7X2D3R7_9PROT|nr:inositol monophosphatase family protein [Roseospira navarrensis]MQX37689.1 hypothetical protein [Roseospira navarrensis]